MTVRETQAAEPQIAQAPVRTIHKIVKYGDPVLEKPGATIKKFDAQLEQLAEDMFATMYASQGVGLAAPQIGKSIRLTVVDVTTGKNPEAKNRDGESGDHSCRRRGPRGRGLPLDSGVSRLRDPAAVCHRAGAERQGRKRLRFAAKTCWRALFAMSLTT